MSYNLLRELEQLPARLEELETELTAMQEKWLNLISSINPMKKLRTFCKDGGSRAAA